MFSRATPTATPSNSATPQQTPVTAQPLAATPQRSPTVTQPVADTALHTAPNLTPPLQPTPQPSLLRPDAHQALRPLSRTSTAEPTESARDRPRAATQKLETLDALARFRARKPGVWQPDDARAAAAAQRTRPAVVPVDVREENPRGDDIVVTLREGHWVEKPRAAQHRVPLGLHTGKPVTEYLDRMRDAVIDADVARRGIDVREPERTQVLALATQLRLQQRREPGQTTQVTDPRTPEGAAWLQREFEKVRDRVSDPASKPRQEVIDWIIKDDFPPKAARTGQDTYWEHIFLRYCGGDHLPLDLERNYSKELRWAYIGEWNASGKGHPAIHTSATLLNDKLAGTGYDVFETKFMPVGDKLCVTELWGYRDDKVKHNQVTDGVDTFWIANGEITHKMISLTVTDADGNPRDYYRKIGQPFPPDEQFEKANPVE